MEPLKRKNITTELIDITPVMARTMLDKNGKNRQLKRRLIEQLAADIKSGDFHITHQGIAFDNKGDLIDGQHRLSAIVLADKSVPMYITRGLDPEMMNVVDIGAKRTQADVLSIHGHGSSIVLAAAANIYHSFLNKSYAEAADRKGRYINNFKLLDFVKSHPELIRAVEWTQTNKQLKQLGSASVVAAFFALLHKKNKSKADEFFAVLAENYSEKRHHPALTLNNHILRKKAQGITIKRVYLMAAIIRSWDNFLANEFASNIVIKDPNQVIRDFK